VKCETESNSTATHSCRKRQMFSSNHQYTLTVILHTASQKLCTGQSSEQMWTFAQESCLCNWSTCNHNSMSRNGLSSVIRPRQHSIGYIGDRFYRSKDPTNSIKVLKEQIVHRQIKHTISRHEHKKNSKSPSPQ